MPRPLPTSFEELHARVLEAYRDRDVAYLIASLDDMSAGGDPPIKIRRVAARVLGVLGAVEAVPGLTRLLEDDDWLVRAAAVKALGRIGSPDAVEALIGATCEPVWQVREFAAGALGKIGDPRATGALSAMLSEDREQTRYWIAKQLATMGDVSAIPALEEAAKREWWWKARHYRHAIEWIRTRDEWLREAGGHRKTMP